MRYGATLFTEKMARGDPGTGQVAVADPEGGSCVFPNQSVSNNGSRHVSEVVKDGCGDVPSVRGDMQEMLMSSSMR
jgi:hypothetical protein